MLQLIGKKHADAESGQRRKFFVARNRKRSQDTASMVHKAQIFIMGCTEAAATDIVLRISTPSPVCFTTVS